MPVKAKRSFRVFQSDHLSVLNAFSLFQEVMDRAEENVSAKSRYKESNRRMNPFRPPVRSSHGEDTAHASTAVRSPSRMRGSAFHSTSLPSLVGILTISLCSLLLYPFSTFFQMYFHALFDMHCA